MSDIFTSEIAFLKRKLPTVQIEWKAQAAMSQLMSQSFSEADARSLIQQYKNIMGRKAGVLFHQIFFTAPAKLSGGLRVIVSVNKLRESFADEIDGWSGGGGRGLNPLKTRPTRGGI